MWKKWSLNWQTSHFRKGDKTEKCEGANSGVPTTDGQSKQQLRMQFLSQQESLRAKVPVQNGICLRWNIGNQTACPFLNGVQQRGNLQPLSKSNAHRQDILCLTFGPKQRWWTRLCLANRMLESCPPHTRFAALSLKAFAVKDSVPGQLSSDAYLPS